MDPRLVGLLEILKLNERLFCDCVQGMPDELARQRPNAETHSAAFLACHVVDARDCLARLLGIESRYHVRHKLPNYLAAVQEQHEPPMEDVLASWKAVSGLLTRRLSELKPDDLDALSEEKFPTDDPTVLGALVFVLHHESYHIGQLAMVRKYLGVSALRYGHRAVLVA